MTNVTIAAEKDSIPEGSEGRDEVLQRQAADLKQADKNLILQVLLTGFL